MVDSPTGVALLDEKGRAGVEQRKGVLACPRCGGTDEISCWDPAAEQLLVHGADPDIVAAAAVLARAGIPPTFEDRRMHCYSCSWTGLFSAGAPADVFRIRSSLP